MKLVGLIVKNFRGYSKETVLNIGDLTALIGKNDAGKSTLLEALEIFFNNKLVYCEKDDLSVKCSGETDTIEISCVFSDFPTSLTIDSSSETSLASEYLLNEDNLLQIKKSYKCSAAKPKPVTTIVCLHPTEDKYHDLLQLKQKDLKNRATTLGVNEESYDARNNASIRSAIWRVCNDLKLQPTEVYVDLAESKKIYSVLETYLPEFALFQSDRTSSDSDKEIADPMGVAVSQALQGLNQEISTIKAEVQKKAMESAKRTLEKLKEMDPSLADSLIPEFKSEPKFDSLFKLSVKSDDGISINKRGSGVRRLILLNFFRAEAERKLAENEKQNNIIYAFEEPETSQHPSHQKMLIESFIKLSEKGNCQVLLTTHTPSLGELLPLESLRLITKDSEFYNIIQQGSEDIYLKIIDTLGILSESIPQSAKGVLLVEGKADITFFEHLCDVLKEKNDIACTLKEKGIAILPIGGCNNLKDWVTRRLIDQFNLPWAVIIDSDRLMANEATKNTKVIEELTQKGILAFTTRKREVENYLHPDIFGNKVTIQEFNDVKKEVNLFNDRIGPGKVLETYWPKMTYDQIQESQVYINESGDSCFELTDMINRIMSMV
ncbi:ATP-dependent endonuclease [Enterococcus gallinarum]|uniref:ATP-dependent endonuclease n=1 Tax=Enterococcus TaxID=1350 RepID=UPI0032E3A369